MGFQGGPCESGPLGIASNAARHAPEGHDLLGFGFLPLSGLGEYYAT